MNSTSYIYAVTNKLERWEDLDLTCHLMDLHFDPTPDVSGYPPFWHNHCLTHRDISMPVRFLDYQRCRTTFDAADVFFQGPMTLSTCRAMVSDGDVPLVSPFLGGVNSILNGDMTIVWGVSGILNVDVLVEPKPVTQEEVEAARNGVARLYRSLV